MTAPIHIEWHNRPGVGEYGAWRIHGGHDGFDSYTLPLATVYGTAAGGVVVTIGYEATGWGHFIDVRYPNYTERHCHLNERPDWIKVGSPVNASTAIGRVGRTGNAKNIFWIRNGVELWHVHSEVYLSRFVQFAKRTNPLPIWGASTAGGGSEIIIPELPTQRGVIDMPELYGTTMPNAPVAQKYLSVNAGLKPNLPTYLLMGGSPGTPFNAKITQDQKVASDWARQLAPTLANPSEVIIPASWGWADQMWDQALAPLRIDFSGLNFSGPTGGASKADVDAAAAKVIEAIPTTFVKG